jgi:glycosyl transferase, family 25
MFDIHVISLARSDRRTAISGALERAGASFHIEDALDARVFTDEQFHAIYDDAAARRRYGRSLSRAEVACFVSHRRVWQKVADSGKPAVIVEDDALFEPPHRFESFLHASGVQLARAADIVLLGRSKVHRRSARWIALNEPLKRYTIVDGFRVGVPFKQWTSGAVGYWLSAEAARQALEHSSGPVAALLDDWPYHRDHSGLRVAELRPYAVWEAFETMPSSIEDERRASTRFRGTLHETILRPLRLARTAARWTTIAGIRLKSRIGKQ